MTQQNLFLQQAQIDFPIIMAPMFLVSRPELLKAGMRAGILATFPTLNYRKEEELTAVLRELRNYQSTGKGNFGVNLIVQSTNPYYKKHLAVCVREQVPFYITSLGNPSEVILAAHTYGAKVYCDVTTPEHAAKCAAAGCDGFIAVGQGAGGHAGPHPLQILIPLLKRLYPHLPVIAAGGITDGASLLSVMVLGASGASVGTRFIASSECEVPPAYKSAIISAELQDIVMSTKLSGTPASIINTEAARRLGYEQNWLEKFMSKHPMTKKWFKMLVQVRGMKKLEKSILPNNYLQLWSAGKSSALIEEVLPAEEIVRRFRVEYKEALQKINATC